MSFLRFIGFGLALLATSCVSVPDPEPADWLAVSFRTPEAAFKTFQTAFAGNQPALEYRCLSDDFKARISPEFTEIAYREYRDELLRRERGARYLPLAEIIDVTPEQPQRRGFATITAEINVLWHRVLITVDLVAEPFMRVQAGDDVLLAERLSSLAEAVEQLEGGFSRVNVLPIEGIPVSEFSEILVATDWKIDDLRVQSDP